MGRQILFHMLSEDQAEFLHFVQESDPIVVTLRDSDSSKIQPAAEAEIDLGKPLSIWNRRLLPYLERKWIPDPGYYRVDELRTPTLELTSSFAARWEGKPALGQGRLYGIFEGKLPEFEKWYESLVRWLRRNYRRNPRGTVGYVGPGAYAFYKSGGYLLPNFVPPKTKEWLSEIGKQHRYAGKTARASKGTRRRA